MGDFDMPQADVVVPDIEIKADPYAELKNVGYGLTASGLGASGADFLASKLLSEGTGQAAGTLGGTIGGLTGAAGGMITLAKGVEELGSENYGTHTNGIADVVQGGAGAAGGVLSSAGALAAADAGLSLSLLSTTVAAAPAATVAGTALGGFATGMALGRFGDQGAGKTGLIDTLGINHQGKDHESVSDWMANNGLVADQAVGNFARNYVSDDVASTLGTGAGLATTLASTIPGFFLAMGGAVGGGIKMAGDLFSHLAE